VVHCVSTDGIRPLIKNFFLHRSASSPSLEQIKLRYAVCDILKFLTHPYMQLAFIVRTTQSIWLICCCQINSKYCSSEPYSTFPEGIDGRDSAMFCMKSQVWHCRSRNASLPSLANQDTRWRFKLWNQPRPNAKKSIKLPRKNHTDRCIRYLSWPDAPVADCCQIFGQYLASNTHSGNF
jgi:hypothetical protein